MFRDALQLSGVHEEWIALRFYLPADVMNVMQLMINDMQPVCVELRCVTE